MLAEAAATDRREDELLGADNRGDELPEGLRSREGRLHRLKECKARLEAEDVQVKYEAQLARRATIQQETGRRPVGRPPKPKRPTKNSLVANPTDPDSRVMKRQYTYLQGYNAQAVVNEDHIVLAARITQDAVDLHQLHPMLPRPGPTSPPPRSLNASVWPWPTPATTARPTWRWPSRRAPSSSSP
jgi:hypothetical protein